MLPVLDTDAMREADRHTIEDLGVPGIVLMENAATGVVEAVRDAFPDARRVLVLAGPGNNGGDGLAVARHLHNGGHEVRVLLFADPDRLSGDAAANWFIAQRMGVPVTAVPEGGVELMDEVLAEMAPEVVVDALLGTGLDRPLGGRIERIAQRISAAGLPVVAVDVPTGLSGASSEVPGTVLEAELTVTFGALKTCHVLPPACLACGEVAVVDIGIPPHVLERGCSLRWPERDDLALMLPHRAPIDHKGTFGHLLIVAGGTGRGGAVAMAGRAAVVTGAGLVTMAVPAPVVPIVDGGCLEAMSHPLPADESGDIAGPGDLEALLEKITAVATGPGLGTTEGARETVGWLLDSFRGPVLLDADAVNIHAGEPERLAGRDVPPVLTPHPGELARLLGRETKEVVRDRLTAAREAARRARAVVVAKGFRTVVATAEGAAWVIPAGDQHLASGGAGDVLTGCIGALLAGGMDPARAALLGCWLHGRAGELAGEEYPAAVPAGILPDFLPRAWSELVEP